MRDGTSGLDVELGRRWQVGRRLRLQGPCPMGLWSEVVATTYVECACIEEEEDNERIADDEADREGRRGTHLHGGGFRGRGQGRGLHPAGVARGQGR